MWTPIVVEIARLSPHRREDATPLAAEVPASDRTAGPAPIADARSRRAVRAA
jgi:hypothetical protein